MSVDELAWAAGFFEGEGYVATNMTSNGPAKNGGHYRSPRFLLTVAQCDRRALDRFQAAVGGLGNIRGPYKAKTDNSRPHWVFAAESRKAEAIINLLLPFMGDSGKADQAKAAQVKIEAHRTRLVCLRGHSLKSPGARCRQCHSDAAKARWARERIS